MAKKMQAETFMGIPTIIGSYTNVASYLDQLASKTTADGVLFTFPNFVEDITTFALEVMPLLKCRKKAQTTGMTPLPISPF